MTKVQYKYFFSLVSIFLVHNLPEELGRSSKTVKSYRDALILFRRYITEVLHKSPDNFEFKDCNRKCILEFLQYLKNKGDKETTRNQRLAAIKSYMNYVAIKDFTLQSYAIEVRQIHSIRETKTLKTVLSEVGMTALLRQPNNSLKGIRNCTLMILLYDTAIRLNEALSLTLTDTHLHVETPYIVVNGKGNKQRELSLSKEDLKHLKQYISLFHNKNSPHTDYMFYTVIGGNPKKISQSTVETFIQKYADRARKLVTDIPEHVYPHMFRAFRATQLYQDGVSLDIIGRMLGHEYLETTRIYAKPSKAALKKAIDSIAPKSKMSKGTNWKNLVIQNSNGRFNF